MVVVLNKKLLKLVAASTNNVEKALVELFTKNGGPLRMIADRSFKVFLSFSLKNKTFQKTIKKSAYYV